MLEIIIEVVGELLLQLFVEILVELGFHSLAEPFRKPPNPWLAAVGYALLGAIIGGISLWLLPNHLTPSQWRPLNVLAVPVLAGIAMMMLGRWRARRGDTVMRIDRFAYGYLFALSLALIRFHFAA